MNVALPTKRDSVSRHRTGVNRVSAVGYVAAVAVIALALFSVIRFDYCTPREVPWLKDTPIAHRGLHDADHDENSLGAFANAAASGYAIELDVRLTRDGVPVVIHDSSLRRMTGVDEVVSRATLADLKKMRLSESGEEIPTLSEALSQIRGQVPVLVEVKDFGIPGKLETAVLQILDGYTGQYAFQSFNPFVCRWLRERAGDVPVGLLLADIPSLHWRWIRNLKDNLFSAICSPEFISYNLNDMDSELAAKYRSDSVTVLGWGVSKDLLDDTSYLDYVDNVIFDLMGEPPQPD